MILKTIIFLQHNIIMKLIPLYFILSMFITMMIIYIFSPNPQALIKYPTPTENFSCTYIDDKGICYKYQRKEIKI